MSNPTERVPEEFRRRVLRVTGEVGDLFQEAGLDVDEGAAVLMGSLMAFFIERIDRGGDDVWARERMKRVAGWLVAVAAAPVGEAAAVAQSVMTAKVN